MSLDTISWFRKYKPKTIDEYVFDNEEQKHHVLRWIENKSIDGNLCLSGPAGRGKTALAEILIRSIIEKQADLNYVKDRSVKAIDELQTWIQRLPIASKQKIIYIEEFDKLSRQAVAVLKADLMEKYQEHTVFIGTTNYLNRIDKALRTRFTHHFTFEYPNVDSTCARLSFILEQEKIDFNESELKEFTTKNINYGLRDLINNIQVNSINKKIDFNKIKLERSELEDQVVNLTMNIFNLLISSNNNVDKRMCILSPMMSVISKEYTGIIDIVQYNMDIDYESIFLSLQEKIQFMPITKIIDAAINDLELKRIPYIHFLSFLYEMMKAIIEINI